MIMDVIRTSYWDNNGKYQVEYNRLNTEYVPSMGDSETIEGELIRAIGRLFHEYCNNGNCNAAERDEEQEEETCWDCSGNGYTLEGDEDEEECCTCGGDGFTTEYVDGELEISEFYDNFLKLIEAHVPNSTNKAQGVRELICNDSLHYNYKYTKEEMDVYNDLCDIVIEYVLEKEKTGFSKLK